MGAPFVDLLSTTQHSTPLAYVEEIDQTVVQQIWMRGEKAYERR